MVKPEYTVSKVVGVAVEGDRVFLQTMSKESPRILYDPVEKDITSLSNEEALRETIFRPGPEELKKRAYLVTGTVDGFRIKIDGIRVKLGSDGDVYLDKSSDEHPSESKDFVGLWETLKSSDKEPRLLVRFLLADYP